MFDLNRVWTMYLGSVSVSCESQIIPLPLCGGWLWLYGREVPDRRRVRRGVVFVDSGIPSPVCFVLQGHSWRRGRRMRFPSEDLTGFGSGRGSGRWPGEDYWTLFPLRAVNGMVSLYDSVLDVSGDRTVGVFSFFFFFTISFWRCFQGRMELDFT